MKKYAIKKTDGTVAIMMVKDDTSPHDLIAEWGPECQAEVVSVRPIDDTKIPADREWRNAWTDDFDTDTIDVDTDKAIAVQLEKLREERNAKLTETDVELVRAVETEDTEKVRRVKAKRKALRDATEPLKAMKGNRKKASAEDLDKIKETGTLPE